MKRCPACNPVETDNAPAFCRADGTALIDDSGPVGAYAGTIKIHRRSGVDLFLTRTEPLFDRLRGDPRFQELLKGFDPLR